MAHRNEELGDRFSNNPDRVDSLRRRNSLTEFTEEEQASGPIPTFSSTASTTPRTETVSDTTSPRSARTTTSSPSESETESIGSQGVSSLDHAIDAAIAYLDKLVGHNPQIILDLISWMFRGRSDGTLTIKNGRVFDKLVIGPSKESAENEAQLTITGNSADYSVDVVEEEIMNLVLSQKPIRNNFLSNKLSVQIQKNKKFQDYFQKIKPILEEHNPEQTKNWEQREKQLKKCVVAGLVYKILCSAVFNIENRQVSPRIDLLLTSVDTLTSIDLAKVSQAKGRKPILVKCKSGRIYFYGFKLKQNQNKTFSEVWDSTLVDTDVFNDLKFPETNQVATLKSNGDMEYDHHISFAMKNKDDRPMHVLTQKMCDEIIEKSKHFQLTPLQLKKIQRINPPTIVNEIKLLEEESHSEDYDGIEFTPRDNEENSDHDTSEESHSSSQPKKISKKPNFMQRNAWLLDLCLGSGMGLVVGSLVILTLASLVAPPTLFIMAGVIAVGFTLTSLLTGAITRSCNQRIAKEQKTQEKNEEKNKILGNPSTTRKIRFDLSQIPPVPIISANESQAEQEKIIAFLKTNKEIINWLFERGNLSPKYISFSHEHANHISVNFHDELENCFTDEDTKDNFLTAVNAPDADPDLTVILQSNKQLRGVLIAYYKHPQLNEFIANWETFKKEPSAFLSTASEAPTTPRLQSTPMLNNT